MRGSVAHIGLQPTRHHKLQTSNSVQFFDPSTEGPPEIEQALCCFPRPHFSVKHLKSLLVVPPCVLCPLSTPLSWQRGTEVPTSIVAITPPTITLANGNVKEVQHCQMGSRNVKEVFFSKFCLKSVVCPKSDSDFT